MTHSKEVEIEQSSRVLFIIVATCEQMYISIFFSTTKAFIDISIAVGNNGSKHLDGYIDLYKDKRASALDSRCIRF